MPPTTSWTHWCTYDWRDTDQSTKIAFNFYCNKLLPKVNQEWYGLDVRLKNDMIDVCTISDEVFVMMQVFESFDKRLDLRKDGGMLESTCMTEDVRDIEFQETYDVDSYKHGTSIVSSQVDIDLHNNWTLTVIRRRKSTYAKQWCEMVRKAKYDRNTFFTNKYDLIRSEIESCGLEENARVSSLSVKPIICLPVTKDKVIM
jgi:hypothetical protein